MTLHLVFPTSGVTIIVPEGFLIREGDSAQNQPFNWSLGSSFRYQQVIEDSQFFSIRSAGGFITDFQLRMDSPLGHPFTATFQSIQINFSTIPRAPDSLSPVFAENVGVDDAVAFGPGPLHWAASYSSGSAPQAWEPAMHTHLTTPFFYNPNAGNLLMDVRVFTSAMTSPMDGEARVGDPISSVLASSVGAASGTPSTFGFITLFEATPVPEPGAVTLAVMAGVLTAVTGLLRRRKERRSRVAA